MGLIITCLLIFSMFLSFIYRRLVKVYGLKKRTGNLILVIFAVLTVLAFGSGISAIYGFKCKACMIAGLIWISLITTHFIFQILEYSLSLIKPQKSRIHMMLSVLFTLIFVSVTIADNFEAAQMSGPGYRIIIFTAMYYLLVYFFFYRVYRGLGLEGRKKGITALILWITSVQFIASMLLKSDILKKFAENWIGVLSIGFTLLIFECLASLIFRKYRKQIVQSVLILIPVITCFALYFGSGVPVVKEIKIHVPSLPAGVGEYTVVHLTDLHYDGSPGLEPWIKEVVEVTDSLKPDLVAVTGDLFDGSYTNFNNFADYFKKISAKDGVWAVTGNHEYYFGIKKAKKIIKEAGIRLLENESVKINSFIQLSGIDDSEGKHFGAGPDTEKALGNIDRSMFNIFLSHRPDIFKKVYSKGVDLQLSGHTHMGQIPPMTFIVMLYYRYPYGLYREGNSWIYTSSGTRLWGMPMRLFSRNEIVKIVLYRD